MSTPKLFVIVTPWRRRRESLQASTTAYSYTAGHYEVAAAPAHLVYATIFSPQALINASETVVVLQAKRERESGFT